MLSREPNHANSTSLLHSTATDVMHTSRELQVRSQPVVMTVYRLEEHRRTAACSHRRCGSRVDGGTRTVTVISSV